MKTWLALAAVLACGLVSPLSAPGGGDNAVLAVVDSSLARVDPVSFEQRDSRRLRIGRWTSAWAYSEDRSGLALASRTATVSLVEVDGLRERASVALAGPPRAAVMVLRWTSAERLLAVLQRPRSEGRVGLPRSWSWTRAAEAS